MMTAETAVIDPVLTQFDWVNQPCRRKSLVMNDFTAAGLRRAEGTKLSAMPRIPDALEVQLSVSS
jgi:hypothetical protein